MPVRELITVPDDTLRKISEPLNKVELNEKKLIKDLFETMYHHNGIGLAAVQVGIHKRIIVLDVSKKDDEKNPLCFINPVIKKISQKTSIYEEGCLSIPNTFIEIERPKICTISYVDQEGVKKEKEVSRGGNPITTEARLHKDIPALQHHGVVPPPRTPPSAPSISPNSPSHSPLVLRGPLPNVTQISRSVAKQDSSAGINSAPSPLSLEESSERAAEQISRRLLGAPLAPLAPLGAPFARLARRRGRVRARACDARVCVRPPQPALRATMLVRLSPRTSQSSAHGVGVITLRANGLPGRAIPCSEMAILCLPLVLGV